jgi:hypothetical protein
MRKLLTFLIAVASLTITTLAFAQSPQVRLLLLGAADDMTAGSSLRR